MHPFEALAEPARRRIIEVLASGEHTAGQLAEIIGQEFRISRTAVSKHLRLLRDAECVEVRAEENWRWYRLSNSGFETLEGVVADLRHKVSTAIGWDADARAKRDPLGILPRYRPVRFKGAGRQPRRGQRGARSDIPRVYSPDDLAPPRVPIELAYPLAEFVDDPEADFDF